MMGDELPTNILIALACFGIAATVDWPAVQDYIRSLSALMLTFFGLS